MLNYCDYDTRGFSMSDTQSKTTFEIFYKNVRGLRTKQTELFDNVSSIHFQIICLTETRLNDMCFDHKLFPDSFTIFRSDRFSSTKSRGGGVLIAVSSRVRTSKGRYLQFDGECVGVEISTQNGRSLLIGNHYSPPPPTILNRNTFLNIFVLWRKTLILKITVFFRLGISVFVILTGRQVCPYQTVISIQN
jgi:hypothetical protein